MNFEKYVQIAENVNRHIHPQKSVELCFDGTGLESADRLFFTGETAISYFWKSEPDYAMLYRRIDDSLRSDCTVHDRFCLDLSGERAPYTKLVYKRLDTPFKLSYKALVTFDDHWSFGLGVWAKDFKVYGYARVTLEVRYQKEGVHRAFTGYEPDEIFTIDIPQGSYDYTELSRAITLDADRIANVGYYVEVCDCEGRLYAENPSFKNCEGRNLVTQFAPFSADRPLQNWMGQNLSKVEWVDMRIELNGATVFDGAVFERCHRFSEWEVPLEKGTVKAGANTLRFTCLSDYRDAAGYDLGEVGLIFERPSAVISVPEIVTAGKPFYVLVDAPEGKTFSFSSAMVTATRLTCEQEGLNWLEMICNTPSADITFALDGEEFTVSRAVLRGEDGVITGTGDLIYVANEDMPQKNFLKWYISNGIGNLLTIRPTYRWGGTRIQNDALWKRLADLLNAGGIRYSHMLDGRELPGGDCNPPPEALENPAFLGRQTHEFDGQFCYWNMRNITDNYEAQMHNDLFLRLYRGATDRCQPRYLPEVTHYYKDIKTIFIDPVCAQDMRAACELFINSLQETRKGNLRHTGPATLFKYFYQAGYQWTGAELMYTPTEITAASIRGAQSLYGGSIGAHLAVQWSSSPHDTESRYRRYRLALFTTYLQGIDEINTEEGLWHLEEYYYHHHRFSDACVNHTKQQQDFYRYISSHTRTGKFYTPIAFLSGRYDGWRLFSRADNTWGRDSFGFSEAEAAWDVLTYYYPKSVMDRLYKHDCPDTVIGYYSGTPQGNVDILPVEAEDFADYRLLVAAGYHCAAEEDLRKFASFVRGGGTMVLGWPQLSTTTARADVVEYRHTYLDGKEHTFVGDSFEGHPLSVCDEVEYDSVVLTTDDHRPLVVKKAMGAGAFYFITAKEYAGNPAVDAVYRRLLGMLTPQILADEPVYAEGNDNVQFAVYRNPDGSANVYFLATDWHLPDPSGRATLIVKDRRYDVAVPFGQLVKIAVFDTTALYPLDDQNEVISLTADAATVQGRGKAEFVLLQDGRQKIISVDFSENAVQTLNF